MIAVVVFQILLNFKILIPVGNLEFIFMRKLVGSFTPT